MLPRTTPSRKLAGRNRLRKVCSPDSGESAEPTPAHGESLERRGKRGRRGLQFEELATPRGEKEVPPFPTGANQHFDDVVDLSALPPALQSRIVSRAPFLLGLQNAVYDKKFYIDVAGLCAIGPHPNEITEKMVPKSKWGAKWGANDDDENLSTRIWLKDADNDDTRERYESLYTRVYGNKPDNGSLANFFMRAATYYLEDNQLVDWAALALEIHQKRVSNPELNPMKLMPPCLSKQVQQIVNELVIALSDLEKQSSCPEVVKNLGPSYLDVFKSKVTSAEEDEADCMNRIIHLKSNLAMDENRLAEANKALNNHKRDLELLFKSKQDASVNGDTAYVNSAFDQINAIAKTITDAVEVVNGLESEVEQSKNNVEIAEIEILPTLTSCVSDSKISFLDAVGEVGLFPQHVLHKLPQTTVMEELCPYCCRAYIENAYVPLSCGCRYHPPCMRVLILTGQVNCLACGERPHGTWMAYWGFPLTAEMAKELEAHRVRSVANEQWVEAACDRVGSSVVPIGPEPLAVIDPMAMIPVTN